VKVKATFVIEEDLLIRLKMAAVKGRKSYSEIVEELIRKGIGGGR
jgi:predicted CopG family antitoxin